MRPTESSLFSLTSSLLLLAASVLHAQEPLPGARVRLDAPGYVASEYVGTVLAHTGDTIRVVNGDGGAQLVIPMSRIRSLEISRGKSHTEGAITGMKWTVPIMATFGAVVAATARCGNDPDCREPTFGDRVGFTGFFALSGAMWGAGIGAIIGREHWVPMNVADRVALRMDASHLGIRIALGH